MINGRCTISISMHHPIHVVYVEFDGTLRLAAETMFGTNDRVLTMIDRCSRLERVRPAIIYYQGQPYLGPDGHAYALGPPIHQVHQLAVVEITPPEVAGYWRYDLYMADLQVELDRLAWGPKSITRFFRLQEGAYVEYDAMIRHDTVDRGIPTG